MANYKVELNKRLLASFPSLGIYIPNLRYHSEFLETTQRIVPNEDRKRPYERDYGDIEISEGLDLREEGQLSLLNTPLWDVVKVRTLGDTPVQYEFPNDPILDVQLAKKVTETEIAGGASIIEMQGNKAADFRFRGVLWANDGYYPKTQLEQLLEVFRENEEIEVEESKYFGMLGINTLVCVNLSLPGIEGYEDSQPFVLTMKETSQVELTVNV